MEEVDAEILQVTAWCCVDHGQAACVGRALLLAARTCRGWWSVLADASLAGISG
jgi:hypothetical protein